MSAIKKLNLISVDDYLAGELTSPVKHEYLAGVVYAMSGARVAHNVIAANFMGRLYGRMSRKRCRPYTSDMKIRVRFPTHVRFYYPDVSVICDSNPQDDSYQDNPVVIVEIASNSTRRIDEGEKKDAYLTIPTLQTYAIVEQETAAVVVHRRTEQGFVREVYEGVESVIPLPEIDTNLTLAEIYEGVEFVPEPNADLDT